jgi:DNA-binding NarL/FixJ family response regulator
MNPRAKVIVASGYSVAGQLERISEAGAKAFIHKPYDVQEMLMTVRRVLDEDL